MPRLLNNNKKYDLIFIDGFHTFDYTLLDFFYADLLLNIDGYIIIDDIKHPGVRKCYDYIKTNYKHYTLYNTPVSSSMATFKKTKEDTRKWNVHEKF